MATNAPTGDNARKRAVRKPGDVMDQTKGPQKFKGNRREGLKQSDTMKKKARK